MDAVTLAVVEKQTNRINENQMIPIKDTNELEKMYPDRFKGLDKFPGKYHIELKDDSVPVVRAPRKYPIHIKDEIMNELKSMSEMGVIEPVPEGKTTERLNEIAHSRKASGKLRICLDPKDINDAIKRSYHRAPTVEEIIYKVAGATSFSKLDAKHGYWSVEQDDESSKLTAFNSSAGRYKYVRVPFGLKVSQDIFQETMDNMTV